MNRTKVIWAVVIIVVLLVAGYFLFAKHALSPTNDMGLKPAPAAPSGTSTSDAALQQDAAAIDAQINGFSDDTATVDGSLNDTPVSQ